MIGTRGGIEKEPPLSLFVDLSPGGARRRASSRVGGVTCEWERRREKERYTKRERERERQSFAPYRTIENYRNWTGTNEMSRARARERPPSSSGNSGVLGGPEDKDVKLPRHIRAKP